MTNDFLNNIGLHFLRFRSYKDIVEGLYLPAIVDSFRRLKNVQGIIRLTENEIRNHLVFDLENGNTILSPFLKTKTVKLTKENTLLLSPLETRRTDFEFFFSGFGDFVVECKNLKSAEQRYINEGVNRFVREDYSKSDESAGMIGFIVAEGKVNTIVTKLQEKIQKESSFVFNTNLQGLCAGYKYSFHSTHSRVTQPIVLYHLFFPCPNSMVQ
jgi:nitrogen regulatory protein PII-like uncharacterized protein